MAGKGFFDLRTMLVVSFKDPPPDPRSRRRLVHLLGLFTLIGFGGSGLFLIAIGQQRDLRQVLFGSGDIGSQIMIGLAAGLGIAAVAWGIISRPFMKRVRVHYADMIGPLMAHPFDRFFISLCAGVGEEIFFRGALQFWLGIPITAIVFVAVHGYLDPRNWRISIYGTMMTLAMILLGWLADRFGLLAPMIAHFLIDLVLLQKLNSDSALRSDRPDQS